MKKQNGRVRQNGRVKEATLAAHRRRLACIHQQIAAQGMNDTKGKGALVQPLLPEHTSQPQQQGK